MLQLYLCRVSGRGGEGGGSGGTGGFTGVPVQPCAQALQWEEKYGPGDYCDYVGGIQLYFP